MWTHYCETEKTTISVGDGEQCNWCNLFTGSGMASINETEARLSTHEEVCAIRYEQINARLKRLEGNEPLSADDQTGQNASST
jgi:hypothetical protein